MLNESNQLLCMHARASGNRRLCRAFTIIELLVVVAIILLLLGILVVAMSAGAKTAQRSRTSALMSSMSKGLVLFKEQIGYYPPVLGVATAVAPNPPGPFSTANDLRRLYPNSVPVPSAGNYAAHMQAYFSTCAMADYLIGYGNHREDGFGATGLAAPNDWSNETPPVGIRSPGDDGVWGATAVGLLNNDYGRLSMRMKMQTGNSPTTSLSYNYGTVNAPFPIDQGRSYGPFVDLKDERVLAAISGYDGNEPIIHFPGEPLPAGQTWDALPKVIVDYWGKPIRYYRRPYPPGALNQSYRAVNGQRVPTLSDVYVLRPWELPKSGDVDGIADGNGDTGTTNALNTAEFALLSAGADKRTNDAVRRDAAELNKDNIVELGP